MEPIQTATLPPRATASPDASSPPEAAAWTEVGLSLAWEDVEGGAVDVVVSHAGIVAVGTDGRGGQVWLSPDGIAWQRIADGPEWDGARVSRVVEWGGRLVAAGSNGGDRAAFWTSGDGVEWERVADSPEFDFFIGSARAERYLAGGGITGLYVDGPELVAVGEPDCAFDCALDPAIEVTWRSADGVHWSRTQRDMGWQWQHGDRLTIGERRQVRLTSGGCQEGCSTIELSADGNSWSEVWRGDPGDYLDRFVPIESGIVALGQAQSSAVFLFSTDGVAWTEPWGRPDLRGGDARGITEFDGRLIAVGSRYGEPLAWVWPPLPGGDKPAARPSGPPGGSSSVDAEWTELPPLPSPFRDGATAMLPDGRLAVVGGTDSSYDSSRTAGLLEPRSGTWEPLDPLPNRAFVTAAVVLEDGSLLAFGTSNWRLQPLGGEWKPVPARPERGTIAQSAALAADGRVYVSSCESCYDPEERARRIDVFDPDTGRWLEPITLPVITSRALLATSGENLLAVTPARIWMYSTIDRSWTAGPALLRGGYQVDSAVALADGRLVLLRSDVVRRDATREKAYTTVEVLDATSTTWSDGPAATSRFGFGSATDGSSVYLLGGAERLIFSDGAWSATEDLARVTRLELAASRSTAMTAWSWTAYGCPDTLYCPQAAETP